MVGDGPGEAAAPMTEEVAVGQFPRGGRAVVGKEHRRHAGRAAVDGTCNQILTRSAFTGDEHRQVMSLQALNLFRHAIHGRAGADETREEGFERPFVDLFNRQGRTLSGAAEFKALPGHRGKHTQLEHRGLAQSGRGHDGAGAAAFLITAERFCDQHAVAIGAVSLHRRACQGAGHARIAAGCCQDANLAAGCRHEHDGRVRPGRLEQRRRGFAREEFRHDGRVNQAAHNRFARVPGCDRDDRGWRSRDQSARALYLFEVPSCTEPGEHRAGQFQVPSGALAGTRLYCEPGQCQLAEADLVPLAKEIKDARAL